ncbi:MAG: hypothetical protein HY288_00715 [Planctomycetia bacterium]|nr:hypothetical protein [Planctomycetia bacterium]
MGFKIDMTKGGAKAARRADVERIVRDVLAKMVDPARVAAAGFAGAELVVTNGANLLVMNPNGKSLFEIRQLVRVMMQGGRRDIPAALRERLG